MSITVETTEGTTVTFEKANMMITYEGELGLSTGGSPDQAVAVFATGQWVYASKSAEDAS